MDESYRFDGLRALIVEDNLSALRGYTSTLRAHGFDVTPVADVESAKQALRNRMYHLAWVDLGLEGKLFTDLKGREVVSYLRQIGDPTFIIVVTVVDSADVARDILREVGADDYLTKNSLQAASWGAVFGRLRSGLDSIARKAISLSDLNDNIFFPNGESLFYANLMKITRPSVPASEFHRSILDCYKRIYPILRPNSCPSGMVMKDCALTGDFWSRELGRAVSIQIRNASVPPAVSGSRTIIYSVRAKSIIVEVHETDVERSSFSNLPCEE